VGTDTVSVSSMSMGLGMTCSSGVVWGWPIDNDL
jgi:hypothetical protein